MKSVCFLLHHQSKSDFKQFLKISNAFGADLQLKFRFGNVIMFRSMHGQKDPKKTKKTIKTQNKTKIISKSIPYTTQLLEGSSLVVVLSASF